MKVLIVHVPYQHRGGEDVHIDALVQGYKEIGITPLLYPENRTPPQHLLFPSIQSLVPFTSFQELQNIWKKERPAYIHVHNAFPTLGPRFFRWIIEQKIPLVMTVHNHRFFCTNGLALRNKKICKDCFSSKVAWRPILYNCNGSWVKSIYHATALTELRLQDLYSRAIKKFVAPSPYLETELILWGIPKERVVHILNPVFWIEKNTANLSYKEEYDVLYAGRLSHEKGIRELISAAKLLPNVHFVIAGDGPERFLVEREAALLKNLTYLGAVTHEEVLLLICKSKIAALPSICNETLSTFALEVFFQGKHCVVPALDSTSWLATGGFPGHLAKAGDPHDLARAIQEALSSPAIETSQKEELQKRLGFHRFCMELKALASEVTLETHIKLSAQTFVPTLAP